MNRMPSSEESEGCPVRTLLLASVPNEKWNVNPLRPLALDGKLEATTMRGVLLWLLGVPISVIILLYLFHVI
jgi:hypothetical protein